MEERKYTYEREIDLVQLLIFLWRKLPIIILVGVIFGILICGYKVKTFQPQPESTYTAIARVYVERDFSKIKLDESLLNSDNVILNEGLIVSEYYKDMLTNYLKEDYKVIMTSNTVLQEVNNRLGLNTTYNELYASITTLNIGSSIVEIQVKNRNKQLAKDIVNAVAEVSSKRIIEDMEAEKVEIIDKGFVSGDKTEEQSAHNAEDKSEESVIPTQSISKSSMLKYIIIGGILGCFLAIAVVLFIYLIDRSIKDEKDIEYYLGLPVIGTVPIIKGRDKVVKKGKRKKSKRLSQYCE